MSKRFILVCMSLLLSLTLIGCKSASEQPPDALEKLITDVFHPQEDEVVLVMIDLPHENLGDNDLWMSRREMAAEWHNAFGRLGEEHGFEVLPIFTYPATGNHNAQLPEFGEMGGENVRLEDVFQRANIVVAMTEYSATAPLVEYSQQMPAFRAASMPTVHQGMMETALAADYQEIARKCTLLLEALDSAIGAELVFSTGEELYIDLRSRHAKIDDGQLPANKSGSRVINLPSGEVYIAPYEGEMVGQPSLTAGMIPVIFGSEWITLEVQNNRITNISGDKQSAVKEMRDWLETDSARRNLAELGLGCNDQAVVTGNVLEDEKVLGVHLAAGRSDHIGGV
ncbi:MAG: aminopeptidase, partial [Anaerolineales bacterium]|nr:aminopeptidase [Anaerolineales bacterium]